MDVSRLAAALARLSGAAAPVEGLIRLSGGANMESWAFMAGGRACVLRRLPNGDGAGAAGIGMAAEAAVLRLAAARGLKVPALVGELAPQDGLGEGFVMERLPGTTAPRRIFAMDAGGLAAACAAQLAAIHALPLDVALPARDAVAELARMRMLYETQGGGRPVLALALRWLAENLPPAVPPALVHGDFRMGNLLVMDGALTAVLDWENAHLGDPCQDIGWACINSWRFGAVDRPALGLVALEEFLHAYEAAGGARMTPERLRFWQVAGSLSWALICLEMAQLWRDGTDRALERLVIGRRVSEAEADILLLLDEAAGRPEPVEGFEERCWGEPSDAELVQGVAEWLRVKIRPLLAGHEAFEAGVALNALGMAARALAQARPAWDAALAARLLAGEAGLDDSAVRQALRRTAQARLRCDQPRYSALKQMRERWGIGDAV